MALDLHTEEAEKRLYRGLNDLEELRKGIAPELADALKDGPAYEGNIYIINDGDAFRIDYKQIGSDVHTIVDVTFASATATGDYKVLWRDRYRNPLHTEMVGRSDLVDVVVAMLQATGSEGL